MKTTVNVSGQLRSSMACCCIQNSSCAFQTLLLREVLWGHVCGLTWTTVIYAIIFVVLSYNFCLVLGAACTDLCISVDIHGDKGRSTQGLFGPALC